MAARNILVYGGRGALGSYCVKHFRELNYNVLSIDIAANKEAHSSIIVDASDSFELQSARALDSLEHALGGSRIKAVLCVAGGWAGGNALSPDFISSTDQMLRSSVWPAAISTAAAARHLEEGGLLVLTGSSACLSGTPGMLGYGMAKAALHQLTTSLACPDAGLPTGAVVSAILACVHNMCWCWCC
jgi:dihydropteridine reductase